MANEYVVYRPQDEEPLPGRTIRPLSEWLKCAEPGWARPAFDCGDREVRREGDVEQEERAAAREWLRHVEEGRIGGPG